MRSRAAFLLVLLLIPRLTAQDAPTPSTTVWTEDCATARSPLASNHKFPNFIGYLSNPLQNIDPRALTQVVPIVGSSWVENSGILPDLDAQVYGPALSLALTERLCVGINQGGYAFLHLDREERQGPLADRLRRDREPGGTREGFLNLGGFVQYTLVEDVENQFLATAGLRVVVPCGSTEIFQGRGPTLLAPYLTVGKELHDFHLLATAGYQFPAESGARETELFYLNAHVDRRCFGWIYPLVEANWTYHTTDVDVNLPTRRGFINFGNFEATGNVVTLAAGVNCVLVPDRLEVGGVYVRGVSTERDLDIDNMILKMVLRF